jgi:hypothetical protein
MLFTVCCRRLLCEPSELDWFFFWGLFVISTVLFVLSTLAYASVASFVAVTRSSSASPLARLAAAIRPFATSEVRCCTCGAHVGVTTRLWIEPQHCDFSPCAEWCAAQH